MPVPLPAFQPGIRSMGGGSGASPSTRKEYRSGIQPFEVRRPSGKKSPRRAGTGISQKEGAGERR